MQIDQSKKFSEFFDVVLNSRKIDFLVLHHVGATSAEHAIKQFIEYQVSSHFLIDKSGKIFQLVDENNIAYHAGVSFWRGVDGLNKTSIGIEFINESPFEKKFEMAQMTSGVELCKYLIAKYKIDRRNVVGHCDIAYSRETGFLDRKQDPSHLFDWKFFAENGVGIFPQEINKTTVSAEKKLFELGDKNQEILAIKQNLKNFGYRLINLNDEFDQEMQALVRVFNRHFIGKNCDFWQESSNSIFHKLIVSF